jgi:hypothetical protein
MELASGHAGGWGQGYRTKFLPQYTTLAQSWCWDCVIPLEKKYVEALTQI